MVTHANLKIPSSSAISSSHRLPATLPSVSKALTRLSRQSLIALALEWLKPQNQPACAPSLHAAEADNDESLYDIADSLEELQGVYSELQHRKGAKREVVDRITEGDWRQGISLQQLAMVDVQYLLDHPSAQRWAALKLAKASLMDNGLADSEEALPRFHGPTFVKNLQRQIGSFFRAHYYLTRLATMPITLLRICAFDSPYNNQASLGKAPMAGAHHAPQVMFVAFADNTPFIYVSFTGQAGPSTGDSKSMRRIITDALPDAFSRPQDRYILESTSLSTRSLSTLVALRGPGRGNAVGGSWSVFADGSIEDSPLIVRTTTTVGTADCETENVPAEAETLKRRKRPRAGDKETHSDVDSLSKRRKLIAAARFGNSAREHDGRGIERFEVRLEDPFALGSCIGGSSRGGDEEEEGGEEGASVATKSIRPRKRRRRPILAFLEADSDSTSDKSEETAWTPKVQFVFNGSHVFAGIRRLVEGGAVDGERMPGWMTGEEGVSVGAVTGGRIRGGRGSVL